jgi:hypothetical protein
VSRNGDFKESLVDEVALSNPRSTPKDYAVWEIHPVMKMEVMQ